MFNKYPSGCKVDHVPDVYVTFGAARDMKIIVDRVDNEVGWFCVVSEKMDAANKFVKYLVIEEVILPKQQVNGTTNEIDGAAQARMVTDLMSTPEGAAKVPKLLAWFHSHASMAVLPSQQDELQMEQFANGTVPYMLRGIVNKSGQMKIDMYWYKVNLIVTDMDIEFQKDVAEIARTTFWDAQIKEKVTKLVPVVPPVTVTHTPHQQTYGYNSYNTNGGFNNPHNPPYNGGPNNIVQSTTTPPRTTKVDPDPNDESLKDPSKWEWVAGVPRDLDGRPVPAGAIQTNLTRIPIKTLAAQALASERSKRSIPATAPVTIAGPLVASAIVPVAANVQEDPGWPGAE